MTPATVRKRAVASDQPSSPLPMARPLAASCQWPLCVCIGMLKPGTARMAKNGITRLATSSAITPMHSRPVLKCCMSRT